MSGKGRGGRAEEPIKRGFRKSRTDQPREKEKEGKKRGRKREIQRGKGKNMNMVPNYKKGNRLEIIKILYAGVVLPYRSLPMLAGEPALTYRMARKMRNEGVLEMVYGYAGKYIVLKDGKRNYHDFLCQYLAQEYLDACQSQMQEYVRCKEVKEDNSADKMRKKPRMERMLNMSEILLMMHLGGVVVYPEERQPLATLLKRGRERGMSYYFNSVEIKKLEILPYQEEIREGESRIQTSRIYGMLVCDSGTYAVYDIGKKLIEWRQYYEVRMKTHIKKLTAGVVEPGTEVGCILIASDMKMFARVITNEYDKKFKGSKILLNIDYAYEDMYGLPATKEGVAMLQLMQQKDWIEKMENCLLAGCSRKNTNYTVICDAVSETDGYILLFCNSNIARLKIFLRRAINAREDERFCIYCFDYQLPLLAAMEIGDTRIKSMCIYDYIKMLETAYPQGE